jgi:hypothetical protein
MKLSLNTVLRQTDGTVEIANIRELPNTTIKHGSNGKYVIEIEGEVAREGFASPEDALKELERQHPD